MKKIKRKSNKTITLYEYLTKRLLLAIILCIGLTSIIYYVYCTNMMISNTKDAIKKVAVAAQFIINGDEHETINDDRSKKYNDMCNILTEFRKKSNVYDVYTLIKADDSHTKFVLASYAPQSTFMENYMFTDKMKKAYYNGEITVTDEAFTDLEGTFYSAYAPLYNSKGKVIALVAVDISVQQIVNLKFQILKTIIFLFLITCLIGIIISYFSIKPINEIIKSLNELLLKVSTGDFSLAFDNSTVEIKEIKDFTNTINTMNKNISFLIKIIAENSMEIDLKANKIGFLVDKANLSAQIITSIVKEMVSTYENITILTKQAIRKNENELQCIIDFKKRYIYFKNMLLSLNIKIENIIDNFNKFKFVYLNNTENSDTKLIKKYINNLDTGLTEVNNIFTLSIDILNEINSSNINNDELFDYNNTIIEKLNKINNANIYIADGINDQAEALQGILEEVDDLKEISNDLNKNLKTINYHKE